MKKNKTTIRYAVSFIGCIILCAVLLSGTSKPDSAITGTWKEVAWQYEKTPVNTDSILTPETKEKISKNLIVHESEIWEFLPNGNMRLYNNDNESEALTWTLKGRGNILKLTHKNLATEHYELRRVSDQKMELHFHTDLQAKGIVKMIFEKINN